MKIKIKLDGSIVKEFDEHLFFKLFGNNAIDYLQKNRESTLSIEVSNPTYTICEQFKVSHFFPKETKACVCGDSTAPGIIHRTDGPCHV